MTRKTLTLALIAAAAGLLLWGGLGVAQGDGQVEISRTNTKEGAFRIDLPVGDYACRFISNYDSAEDGLPSGYIDATAWLKDENEDRWSEFSLDTVKFVKVVPPRPPVGSGDLEEWAEQLREAFASLSLWGTQITITDSTPRIEIDLSRAFRRNALRWTFQCVEFGWPES